MAGGLNGFLNLFVILLATSPLSSSLVYPVIGVGSLMITTLFSTFVFKEKMRWWQWIGIITGMAAVAILSL
jgi:drug/metabolite transporter (DMT)-like permease